MLEENYVDNFNLGHDVANVRQLAEMVLRAFNSKMQPVYEDVKEGELSSTGRIRIPHELRNLVLDSSKARSIGWNPKVGLKEGLKREIKWIQSRPHRWGLPPRV
jgi:nucleoside-diphosphate-sugar epimerase